MASVLFLVEKRIRRHVSVYCDSCYILFWCISVVARVVSFRQEKQRLFLATNLCSVRRGVLSRNTRQSPSGWLSSHTIQFAWTRLCLVPVPFEDALELAAAKTFAPIFVRVSDCALSSFLDFLVETFIISCASALSFTRSLKVKRVGWLQSFLAVCVGQASFMFGGKFLYCLDQKCHTRQVVVEFQGAKNSYHNAKVITFSQLCILTVERYSICPSERLLQRAFGQFYAREPKRLFDTLFRNKQTRQLCLGLASYKRFRIRERASHHSRVVLSQKYF